MPNVSFVGVLIVALVAFLAPLLLGLSPARRLPSVVIEIVAGIMIGPSVLGWVRIDLPISILSLIGLAFLLFLAGMEVELERLRGRLLLYVGGAFVASMGLALLVGSALFAAGQVRAPLFIAIILVATALGVVVPLLTVRHGSQTDATMVLTALDVDLEGSREVLAFRACAEEDKDGLCCLLQDLRNRGVSEIDLLVTDGHDGGWMRHSHIIQ